MRKTIANPAILVLATLLALLDWSSFPPTVRDAAAARCGDGTCALSECNSTRSGCKADCMGKPICCGDHTCRTQIGESCSTCSSDCGVCTPVCGDGVCAGASECSSCPADCDLCSDCGICGPLCGNAVCETDECSDCPSDCDPCDDCDDCGSGGPASVDDGCPQTADPTSQTGETLRQFADATQGGVVYDDVQTALRLKKAGGYFKSTALGVSDLTVYAAVADFDGDGWDDFVGAGESTQFVRIYRNFSFENLPVDWLNPTDILTPKFVNVRQLYSASGNVWHTLAAGDFNGDGRPDVFFTKANAYQRPYDVDLWLNNGNDGSGNPTFRTSYNPMASGTAISTLGYQAWSGTNVAVVDYNGDRKLDLLIGSGEGSGGTIRIFLNTCTVPSPIPATPLAPAPLPCTNDPKFAYAGDLMANLGLGDGPGELPVFAYLDFDGDGLRDLLVGAPDASSTASKRLQLFKGVSGGGLDPTAQSITSIGAATAVLPADYSLDGLIDVIIGTDNWNYNYGNIGGITDYYKNNGTGTPFSAGAAQRLTSHTSALYDFDVGFVFDYDNDPDHTPDLMLADGNHTGNFYVFANRVMQTYVDCGEVASGILDLGALSSAEMVVTAARLSPTMTLPSGTTITFYMSNEDPANWQLASPCTDVPTDYCVAFPQPVGRDVRWKAVMCSDSAHTRTPVLSGVGVSFDYTPAQEHYRGGVIVNDGVAYVGAFRQPGDRGHFYAINAGMTQVYWDAATKLDAMADGDRNLYTATADGTERLAFTTANATSADLQATLNVADSAQAAQVVAWQRSARFGLGGTTRMGSVENSTPAILTAPGLPLWYSHATADERTKINNFIGGHQIRQNLVFFGSKDGALHATRTIPTTIADSANGTEAWGFIPAKVAHDLVGDMSADTITSYPDGSPTLADVMMSDGAFHTVLVMGGGNGGKSVFALDVTETIDDDNGSLIGPDPLWHAVPGDGDAGQARSKPAIARVKIGTGEKYLAIFGTGLHYQDLQPPYTKGRIIYAVDVETGYLAWRFQARCALTNNVVVFETNDDLEPGAPDIDGFIDRAVFADACGYVYKLDPARWMTGSAATDRWNVGIGPIDTGAVDPANHAVQALFSTEHTAEALGAERPIPGTIAAQTDSSTRLILFFGTGGIESYDPNVANEFYAVYADTGEIRSKMTSNCTAAGCEKFYGGVVVTQEQVILTRTIDPPIGQGVCDFGTSYVQGLELNDTHGDFTQDFIQAIGAATVSSLYGDAGAIYFATLSGDIVRIGNPRASEAGGDTSSGAGGGTAEGGEGVSGGGGVGTNQPMTLMGWRQVL